MKHDGMSPHKWKTIISNGLRNVQTFSFWVFCSDVIFIPNTHPFKYDIWACECVCASWTVNDTLEKVTVLLSVEKWKTQQSTGIDWKCDEWNCFNPPEWRARERDILRKRKKMWINMYSVRVNLAVIVKYSCATAIQVDKMYHYVHCMNTIF